MRKLGFTLLASFLLPTFAFAQTAVPAFTIPNSNQLSPEGVKVLDQMQAAKAPKEISSNLPALREFYGKYNDARLNEMRDIFKTVATHSKMGGVGVDIVIPSSGIKAKNKAKVLINVHGGAFMWGAGSGALVEAIPISATMGIKVVTVDYRLSPENHYPAASEDVTAVYKELLKSYRPENIGIYGCSAGGVITAQSVAWIRKTKLPRPGAIGTFCGTGAPMSGDSPFIAPVIGGDEPLNIPALPDVIPYPYMMGVSAKDAVAYPLVDDEEIKNMPPTLLLAGGRDFALSGLTLADRKLRKSGVKSELVVFDGLPHAFFMWAKMPESMEAYKIISDFFDKNLGKK